MTNYNYRNGANFERAVLKFFQDQGMIATRSAGSHGVFDVWATDFKQLYLVQCKRKGTPEYADKVLKEIKTALKKLGKPKIPITIFVAIDLKSEGGLIAKTFDWS